MGVTTEDIFGNQPDARPAIPGTYGEPPRGYRLPAATRLGPVRLEISDLERSVSFYRDILGLRVLYSEGPRAVLGPEGDDTALVDLREHSGVRSAPRRGRLGLFHFAILLPHRQALGTFVRHLGKVGAHAGAGDHLVSEALYLHDPDNLGIEVYADRPRETWRRIGRELMMATDPLDVPGLLRAAGDTPWNGMPSGTVMGHIHLHVGDLDRAAAFYGEAIGFDRTVWQYPGALFLGAGGYHHHVGTNTWAGADAAPATEDDARLLEWTIMLPEVGELDRLARSLEAAGFPFDRKALNEVAAKDLTVRDPWGTAVRIVAAAAS